MKVTIYAVLASNGCYMQTSAQHKPSMKIVADVTRRCKENGCVIVGRQTFEETSSRGQGLQSLGVDVVVVSATMPATQGVLVAKDIQAALSLLSEREHTHVMVVGGEKLLNSFLKEDCFDDLIFNYLPLLSGGQLHLHTGADSMRSLQSLGVTDLGDGIVQAHFVRDGSGSPTDS